MYYTGLLRYIQGVQGYYPPLIFNSSVVQGYLRLERECTTADTDSLHLGDVAAWRYFWTVQRSWWPDTIVGVPLNL